jgi:hypothetical protein
VNCSENTPLIRSHGAVARITNLVFPQTLELFFAPVKASTGRRVRAAAYLLCWF